MKNNNNSTFSKSYAIPTNEKEPIVKPDLEFEKSVAAAANANLNYEPILNEAPVVKDYQKPQIDTSKLPAFLPEATFDSDAQEVTFHENPQPADTPSLEPEASQPQPSLNPQLNDLSKPQKRIAAEMAADTAINAYSMLWQKVLTPAAQFNEKKLQKEFIAGTIDPNLAVYIDQNTTIPIKEFTKGFNENVEDALRVTDEFKQEVREPLIRILEKRGLGLTDEQKVGWEVIQDFGIKTATIISIRNDIKSVMENFRSDTKKTRVSQPAPAPSENFEAAKPEAAEVTRNNENDTSSKGSNQNDTSKNNSNNNNIEVVKSKVPTFEKHPLLQQLDDEAAKNKNVKNSVASNKTVSANATKNIKQTIKKPVTKKATTTPTEKK